MLIGISHRKDHYISNKFLVAFYVREVRTFCLRNIFIVTNYLSKNLTKKILAKYYFDSILKGNHYCRPIIANDNDDKLITIFKITLYF